MAGSGTNRTRDRIAGGPSVVLVRPQLAVNIGMCARAMANFGLFDLRLVNPKSGWPREDEYRDVAYAAAAGASHVLDNARVYPSIEEAVADLQCVYATTARNRGQEKPIFTPAQAMASWGTIQNRCGLLFGPERTGLENDEIALSDAIVSFPANPAYASFNLAQSVLLLGYEWFKATQGDAPPEPVEPRPVSPPAQRDMIFAFFTYLEDKLDEAGYFRPPGKASVMKRNLRNIFHRLKLTEQDMRTLWGVAVRLAEGPREKAQTRERKH